MAGFGHVDVGEVAGDDDDPAAVALHQLACPRPRRARRRGPTGARSARNAWGVWSTTVAPWGTVSTTVPSGAIRFIGSTSASPGAAASAPASHRVDHVARTGGAARGDGPGRARRRSPRSRERASQPGAHRRGPGAPPATTALRPRSPVPDDVGGSTTTMPSHTARSLPTTRSTSVDAVHLGELLASAEAAAVAGGDEQTPDPTRHRPVASHETGLGDGDEEPAAAGAVLGLLVEHLVGEVPDEEHGVVGLLLDEPFDGRDRDASARHQPVVLVRVAVDDELDRLLADARARSGARSPSPRRRTPRRVDLAHGGRRGSSRNVVAELRRRGIRSRGSTRCRSTPSRASSSSSASTVGCDGRGAGEGCRHPEGAAVDRDSLDVDHLQALGREQVTERRERVVEEVLVVDGVELDRVHEVTDVGRLDHEATVVAQDRVPRPAARR